HAARSSPRPVCERFPCLDSEIEQEAAEKTESLILRYLCCLLFKRCFEVCLFRVFRVFRGSCPDYSIFSSARRSKEPGNLSPHALAAGRLTITFVLRIGANGIELGCSPRMTRAASSPVSRPAS